MLMAMPRALAGQDVHDKHAGLYNNVQDEAVAGLAVSKQYQHHPSIKEQSTRRSCLADKIAGCKNPEALQAEQYNQLTPEDATGSDFSFFNGAPSTLPSASLHIMAYMSCV